jgi:uncharacterized membrane protein YoaK (UPF0700 family)
MSATASTSRTDQLSFALACAMAFLAGATDVCGYVRLKDIFVSFMSGNSTMLALALGQGNLGRAATIGEVIGLFVAGVALGAIVAMFTGGRHAAAVTLLVGLLLLVGDRWSAATVPLLALAMGILNAAMHRAGKMGVSLTFVTGTLVRFAEGLGHALCGRPSESPWPLFGLLWLSLLVGAIISTLLVGWLGADAVLMPAILALLLAAIFVLRPGSEG